MAMLLMAQSLLIEALTTTKQPHQYNPAFSSDTQPTPNRINHPDSKKPPLIPCSHREICKVAADLEPYLVVGGL